MTMQFSQLSSTRSLTEGKKSVLQYVIRQFNMSKVRGRKKTAWRESADGPQSEPKWIRTKREKERKQEMLAEGFSEKNKDEERNLKKGELIKTEECALHRREYPDFFHFNLLNSWKELISYFFPQNTHKINFFGESPCFLSLNKQLLWGDEMHLSLSPLSLSSIQTHVISIS